VTRYWIVDEDYTPIDGPSGWYAQRNWAFDRLAEALEACETGESRLVVSMEGDWATNKPLSCHVRMTRLSEYHAAVPLIVRGDGS
jgi:hypothetical protein